MPSSVEIIMGAIMGGVFAAIALIVLKVALPTAGLSLETGLWSLLPILFPFAVIGVLLISIYLVLITKEV